MMTRPMFSPSMMAFNSLRLGEQLEVCNRRADMLHVDVMDGHYVPNLMFPAKTVADIAPFVRAPMDAHLMVTRPQELMDAFIDAGAAYITVHSDTITRDAFRVIERIRARGAKPGVAINPATPLCEVEAYLSRVEKVTVMAVDVGYSGQTFIPEALPKIETLVRWKRERGYGYIVEVDGACNHGTFGRLKRVGCECLVVGTTGLTNLAPDLDEAWDAMLKAWEESE